METKGVYRILNKINGKSYIGSACSNGGVIKRWNEHKSGLKRNKHHNKYLQRAWNKYGADNFIFEILEIVNNTDETLMREQHYLTLLSPEYNICKTAGNTLGIKLSDETKQKISIKKKLLIGDKAPRYGKFHSEKTKQKISSAKKGNCGGNKHPLFGKHHSEETKFKQSIVKLGKISPKRIEIIQMDLNGVQLKIWSSISEASIALNLNSNGNLVSCLKGRIKTAYGFKWKYKS